MEIEVRGSLLLSYRKFVPQSGFGYTATKSALSQSKLDFKAFYVARRACSYTTSDGKLTYFVTTEGINEEMFLKSIDKDLVIEDLGRVPGRWSGFPYQMTSRYVIYQGSL